MAEQGYRVLRFFPASSAGGLSWLEEVAAPLADMRLCPAGGIDAGSTPAHLALPNVACVGGAWVAPARVVAAGAGDEAQRLAAAASRLKRFWS